MEQPEHPRGVWPILAAACLWGTTGTAQALGPATSSPLGVGLMRLLIAAPALLFMAALARALPRRSDLPLGAVLIAGLGMAAYQPAFFTAVDRTGVALGTAVAIGSAPILTGLISVVVERHRPSRAWWLATVLAVGGVAVLAATSGEVGVDLLGMLAALGAGLSYSVYVLASAHVIRSAQAIGATAVIFSLAGVISLPLLLWTDLGWLSRPAGLAMAIHLGLVATALAYVLFATGLRTTRSATAATITLAEPATATLLGVSVLGERPGAIAWAAIGAIFVGLAIAVRSRDRAPAPALPT